MNTTKELEVEIQRQFELLEEATDLFYTRQEMEMAIESFDFEEAHAIAKRMEYFVYDPISQGWHAPSPAEMMTAVLESMVFLEKNKHRTSETQTMRFTVLRKNDGSFEIFYGIRRR